MPPGHPTPATEPPAHVAQLIVVKPGYANFYFNQQNLQRVWSKFVSGADFAAAPDTWILSGKLTNGAPCEIRLTPDEVAGQFPFSRDKVDPRIDLDQQLLPLGSGGLLPALSLWYRMLTVGPQQFGETFYLGTAPLIDREGLFDVLIGTHNVVEARFAFDRQTGRLEAIEMFPETNADPCEVYFDDYRKTGDYLLPHRMVVRYGDSVFAELQVETYELKQQSEEDAPPADAIIPRGA